MAMINKYIADGNLVADPKVRTTTSGKMVANFTVAVNTGWGDKQEVLYIDCEVWEKKAEFVRDNFTKGKAIFFEGPLKMDQWQDKATGDNRSKIVCKPTTVSFVGKKTEEVEVAVGAAEDETPF